VAKQWASGEGLGPFLNRSIQLDLTPHLAELVDALVLRGPSGFRSWVQVPRGHLGAEAPVIDGLLGCLAVAGAPS